MKKNNGTILLRKVTILSAIFFLIGFISCKKDGKLAPDFDSGGLAVNFIDTFTVNTKVVREDSIRTDLSFLNLLGLYNDPIFGPTSSAIYSQVTLTGVNVNLGGPTEPTSLDSIVLTLEYASLYGDTSTPMSVNVYELSEDLSSSTDYYSDQYTSFFPTPIASKTFTPNLEDSVSLVFNSEMKAPHLRIKLSQAFGNKIMSASNQMIDDATFTNYMKGLYITTTDSVSNTSLLPGTGSIVSFNMNSSLSTMTVYYNDTSSYSFAINSAGVKYSRFDHNYTGTDVAAHLNDLPTKDTTIAYVSAMAGVKTKIDIPFIKDLTQEGTVIINKAELEITIEAGSEGAFDNPLSSLSLIGISANGETFFLPDFFEGLDYYGGNYDEDTKTYKFNIARHITDLIYNSDNYGMYLVANGASVSAQRSVVGSQMNPSAKIKLNITYSKL